MAAVATATLTGCGSRENKVETTDFVDDVKVALADSGRIDLNALQWTREPKAFEVKGLRTPTYGSARTITSRTTMRPCYR